MRPLQLLSACCRKTYILTALISSRLCYVLAAPCSSACPSATGCAPCPAYAGITGSFGASFPVYGLCVKIEPYFPAASTRIHPQSSYRIISEGDRFPVSFRANSGQKPVALFRRFVCVGWNPRSFFIAITLIVSVTASRRAPQLGRIFLLLPLDSPLSEKSDVADKEFSVGFALAGEIRLSVSGVCPFLFCALIISSILHNVKRFLRTFSPHTAQ